MTAPPRTLDGHRVVAYASVDARTAATGRAEHIVGGERLQSVHGLAICWIERESRATLLRCTDRWRVLTDTWHLNTEDAKRQAHAEFEGLEWMYLSP